MCAPIPDRTLSCEWSIYTVSWKFKITHRDGNDMALYTARDIAHRWLSTVLPSAVYHLHRVSVSNASRSSVKDNNETSSGDNSFVGLVYLNVIPSVDVAKVQEKIHTELGNPYNESSSVVKVLADKASIRTTPIDHFPSDPTKRPPVMTSIAASTANMSVVRTCPAESQQTRKGLFEWPITPGGENSTQPCPKNTQHTATRHCKLGLSTYWMPPDLQDCHLVVETIPDLDHVMVTPETTLDVMEMIDSLVSNRSELSHQELAMVLDKMEDVVGVRVVTSDLGQALIDTISDVLESNSDLLPFTNTILNLTEVVGDCMVGFQNASTLVASAVAVSMVNAVPGQFAGLTFGVSSFGNGSKPEIFLNQVPVKGTVAFIVLPSMLQHSFPNTQSPSRIQFQFYGIPQLFKSKQKDHILNSFVVSASVGNSTTQIQNLQEYILVTLHHLQPKYPHMETQCVYWNFNENMFVCQMEMEAGTHAAAESTTAALTSPRACAIISHTLEFFWMFPGQSWMNLISIY
ncbi:adhesion G-protein coupled receptor G4-like isoform X2 [Corythoichthys intestinalis]|uniref:adhesion G-protein coupled receptor G4-like isoform X2 n=1 Tax=Corythoichthys intestinalis TaxID=161448 RepID=UPI0025A4FF90|nr:adhesion G-protein coupled receptor G4-like isoform X2 [Corythoichthys intestinalis]